MSPFFGSLAFLGLTVTMLTAWWILPMINAHMLTGKEAMSGLDVAAVW